MQLELLDLVDEPELLLEASDDVVRVPQDAEHVVGLLAHLIEVKLGSLEFPLLGVVVILLDPLR